MARNVEPPKDSAALAKMLAGQQPAADDKPQPVKKAAAQAATPEKLPSGRMGQPCGLKPCTGKFTDLSRAHIAKTKARKGRTLITLICDKCGKVQAQSEVDDLD